MLRTELRAVCAALALLAGTPACGPPEPPLGSMRTVGFGVVLPAGAAGTTGGATSLPTRGGGELPVGGPEPFHVWQVEPAQDAHGGLAVGLRIASSEAESFADFSERIIGERLAIVVDGEIVVAPVVRTRLPAAILIEGGAKGFTPEEQGALVERLRPLRAR